MDVTASIFVRNLRNPYLAKCLSCLPDIPVIIFANEKAEVHYPKVSRIESVPEIRNFNFARNCNLTVPRSDTRWILYLNADCFLNSGCLEEMVAVGEESGAALVSAKLFETDGRIQSRGFSFDIEGFENHSDSANRYDATGGGSGACLLVRRDAARRIPWDENYSFVMEDVDFCFRVCRVGYKAVVANRATAVHLKGYDTVSLSFAAKRVRAVFYFWNKMPNLRPPRLICFRFSIYLLSLPLRRFLMNHAYSSFKRLTGLRNRVMPSAYH